MNREHKYELNTGNLPDDEKNKIEVKVEGEPVHLLYFSLDIFYILSEKLFSEGKAVKVSFNLKDKGKINLIGKVVRTRSMPDGERWGIEIDLTRTYDLESI
ncbi:MAG: PilZ domain-containing protein [Deltaproteobacteria bacterium HGW-Deltaproteobacteria-6]|nr:MAG: PilZ domain-containing protein [Deltaproteobacteria bacterium HGW-Deltaproteobacteria-6]